MSTTIIFSNKQDVDCETLRCLWDGWNDVHLVEITSSSVDWEDDVDTCIKNEDETLIIVGHGTTNGLLFPDYSRGEYVIHENNVQYIHAKRVVCCWCYASDFVINHTIKNSFATSMFISNIDEAYENGIYDTTQDEITALERRFYLELRKLIEKNVPMELWVAMLQMSVTSYSVDLFNRECLYSDD